MMDGEMTARQEAAMWATVAHLWQARFGVPMQDDDWAEVRQQRGKPGCGWVDEMNAAVAALEAADRVKP